MLNITVLRTEFSESGTGGILVVGGDFWGYTLEDRLRLYNQKIRGQTCIPAGIYNVRLEKSSRFDKILPRIKDVENFDGVLFHGGNKPEDTEGCILIARERKGQNYIFGSLSDALVNKLSKHKGQGKVQIINGLGHENWA